MDDKGSAKLDRKVRNAADSLETGMSVAGLAPKAVALLPGTAAQTTQFAGVDFVRHVATSTAPAALQWLASHPIGVAIAVGVVIYKAAQASDDA